MTMSLGVVNPCSVLQLSVLVMAAPPGGRTRFLASLSAVLIAGHLHILQSCPASTLHFMSWAHTCQQSISLQASHANLLLLAAFQRETGLRSCLSCFFPPGQKERGRTPPIHSVDGCWLFPVWMFGSTDGHDACCSDSSILGGPRITTQHLDFGTEPVTAHSSGKRTDTSLYQQCPPSGGSPWLICLAISFPDCQLLLTMELPIPPACKAQIKGEKERLCDLPGVNNIYTTFPNLCICKLLVSHLNRLQLELVMLGVLHTSWRINAAAQSFFCLHCSSTWGNALRALVGNALDAQVTAKGIFPGDEISACHSETWQRKICPRGSRSSEAEDEQNIQAIVIDSHRRE